jgi:hypothetical protein
MDLEQLSLDWIRAKTDEAQAISRRRTIEDEMVQAMRIKADQEGTVKQDIGPWKVSIVTRFNRKVDADLAQEIAAEHGFADHLGTLFRWKPEINAAAWKAADKTITDILVRAVTTTPGRPSFSIEQKDA